MYPHRQLVLAPRDRDGRNSYSACNKNVLASQTSGGVALPDRISVRSEDDAWHLLEDLVEGKLTAAHGEMPFKLSGWPKLRIRIPATTHEGAITPSTMVEMIELQHSLLRAYSLIHYKSENLRLLSKSEKEALEFNVVVRQGSSHYEIDFQAIIQQIAENALMKMDSTQVAVLIGAFMLLYFGRTVFAAYLKDRKETRLAELKSEDDKEHLKHLEFVSAEETKRMQIMADALAGNKTAQAIAEEANEVHGAILRAVSKADGGTVQGIHLNGNTASQLAANSRRTGEDIKLSGEFDIQRVDSTVSDGFLVRLRRRSDGLIVNAGVQDALLSEDHKAIIREAEWQKFPIFCKMDARRVGGSISRATILDVTPAPK
jgi:hypothetical protein